MEKMQEMFNELEKRVGLLEESNKDTAEKFAVQVQKNEILERKLNELGDILESVCQVALETLTDARSDHNLALQQIISRVQLGSDKPFGE